MSVIIQIMIGVIHSHENVVCKLFGGGGGGSDLERTTQDGKLLLCFDLQKEN